MFSIKSGKFELLLSIDSSAKILVISIAFLILLVGIFFIAIGLRNEKNTWSNKVFYYLQGMSNQSEDLPFSALPKMAKWNPPIPVKLKLNSDLPDNIYFKLQFCMMAIIEKINQYKENEIFFAGMARVPCLFFCGYAFRNAHSSAITLIEHIHQSDKWMRLRETDDTGLDTTMEIDLLENGSTVSDIAVLIEFTCEIPENDLPLYLRSNIVRIRLTKEYKHNQIESRKALERVVENIANQLAILDKKCKVLHLFISAQSTVVFSLGRRYQDGMIGNIIVYQYNPIQNRYSWAISLIDNNLKLEKFD
jgi:hypothetical protein